MRRVAAMIAGVLVAIATTANASDVVRVERRLLVKTDRVFVSGGAAYLARGDYYETPTVLARAAWYPTEWGGPELQAGWIFSFPSANADEVLKRANARPDAHRPLALALAGWRQSLAYGKVAGGTGGGRIFHFDLQGSAHGGVVLTDRAVTPALSLGAGVLARVRPDLFGLFEVSFVGAREVRQFSSLAGGVLVSLTVGTAL